MLTSIFEPTHLLLIFLVALVVLGPKRLPDAGRALGQGLKEFRTSISAAHAAEPDTTAPRSAPSEGDASRG
jgi:sec-independent protein translocase protein TatA